MKLSFTQIKETCIYVSDLDKTRAFYEGKLGLECFECAAGRHVFFRVGTSVFLCFNATVTKVAGGFLPPHYGSGQLHFAFETVNEDYEDWKEKVIAAGIPVEQEVDWPKGGKSFYFRDPDNHLVEIVMQGIWG